MVTQSTETGACGFYVHVGDAQASITFQYKYNGEKHPDITFNLSWYAPGFGGRRYFFLCPHCGRRMKTLHIRGGEIACRCRCRLERWQTVSELTDSRRRKKATGYTDKIGQVRIGRNYSFPGCDSDSYFFSRSRMDSSRISLIGRSRSMASFLNSLSKSLLTWVVNIFFSIHSSII